ncbi:hypothetical protein F4777DRAFT_160829 [Nemania sp. FL0916]|nr:hypothetical protein F4777DRAFT_160829 [Nemania sp. FL0916]
MRAYYYVSPTFYLYTRAYNFHFSPNFYLCMITISLPLTISQGLICMTDSQHFMMANISDSMKAYLDYINQDGDCSSDSDDEPGNMNMAHTHEENHVLFERKEVKEFYAKLQEGAQSPYLSNDFIAWLGSIPATMEHTAIPLFRESKSSVGYQVHPGFSFMKFAPSTLPTESPHCYVGEVELGQSRRILAMSFGRLYINMSTPNPDSPNETIRLSKWTGYEVLFDTNLNLWFVFEESVIKYRFYGWYPVKCNLGLRPEIKPEEAGSDNASKTFFDTNSPAGSLDEMVNTPNFQSACVSWTGKSKSLLDLTFAEVQEQLMRTMSQEKGACERSVNGNKVRAAVRQGLNHLPNDATKPVPSGLPLSQEALAACHPRESSESSEDSLLTAGFPRLKRKRQSPDHTTHPVSPPSDEDLHSSKRTNPENVRDA